MNNKDFLYFSILFVIAASLVFISYSINKIQKSQSVSSTDYYILKVRDDLEDVKKNQTELLTLQKEIMKYLDSIETEVMSVTNKIGYNMKIRDNIRKREVEMESDKFMKKLLPSK